VRYGPTGAAARSMRAAQFWMTIIGEAVACSYREVDAPQTKHVQGRATRGRPRQHATESTTGMRTPAARLVQAAVNANYNSKGVVSEYCAAHDAGIRAPAAAATW
jgi:hypothetical protein